MSKINKFQICTPKFLIVSVFVFMILVLPMLTTAYSFGDPLVPCDNSQGQPCDFNAILALVNNLITFTLKYMVVPICAIMFAYAGFKLVTAGEESASAKTEAKNIFTNAALGLIIALAAWLIIKTILVILGYKDAAWIGF